MTTQATEPTPPARRRGRLLRDLLGLVLFVAGAAGVVTVGFLFDPLVGVLVVSVLLVCGGAALATGET